MPLCVVPGCLVGSRNKKSPEKCQSFEFPGNQRKKNEWLRRIRRVDWKPYPDARVCAKHFGQDAFEAADGSKKLLRLKPNAVPTIFDFSMFENKVKRKRKPPKVRETVSIADAIALDHDYTFALDAATITDEHPVENEGNIEIEDNVRVEIVSGKNKKLSKDRRDRKAKFVRKASSILPGLDENNLENIFDNGVVGNETDLDEGPQTKSAKVQPGPSKKETIKPSDAFEDEGPQTKSAKVEPGPSTKETIQPSEAFIDYNNIKDVPETDESYQYLLKRRIVFLEEENAKKDRVIEAQKKALEDKQKDIDHIYKIFNADQRDFFRLGFNEYSKKKGGRRINWCDETIQKSAEIHYLCGTTAYEALRKMNYPFPSTRTLSRRCTSILDFQPGVLDDSFRLLKIKSEKFPKGHNDAVLAIDEMAIKAKIEYDRRSKTLTGEATMPPNPTPRKKKNAEDDGPVIATKALVFMYAGTRSRWKHTVAYHLTADSIDASVYVDIIKEVIMKASGIGINTVAMSTDMGSSNLAA